MFRTKFLNFVNSMKIAFYFFLILFTGFVSNAQIHLFNEHNLESIEIDGHNISNVDNQLTMHIHKLNSPFQKVYLILGFHYITDNTQHQLDFPTSDFFLLNNHRYNLSEYSPATDIFHLFDIPDLKIGGYYLIPITVNHLNDSLQNLMVNQNPITQLSYRFFTMISLVNDPNTNGQYSLSVLQRERNIKSTMLYNLNEYIKNLSFSHDLFLSVQLSDICGEYDKSIITLNQNQLGELSNGETGACNGVTSNAIVIQDSIISPHGDFPYDSTFSGNDGITNIKNYLQPGGINEIAFEYGGNLTSGTFTNPIHQLMFIYTSTCPEIPLEVQEQSDVCQGEFLQLEASGAEEYRWEPQVGLSCYDCPNPIVTTDSSRMWRLKAIVDDSCFVIRPVQVQVRQTGFGDIHIEPSICAESTGVLNLDQPENNYQMLAYSVNGGSPTAASNTGQSISNLPAGTHTLTQYSGHCSLDTSIVIPDSQIVVANFSPTPESGSVPFKCYFEDLSTQATDLTWYVDGQEISEDFYTHLFEEGGEHEVMLIAHRKDSACADTAYMWVLAYEDIVLSLPNIITANGDGINDELLVRSNQPASLQYSIVNRWGTTVHQGELEINEEEPLSLWNGGELNEGTYFLKVIATPSEGHAKEPRSFETFFRLERP